MSTVPRPVTIIGTPGGSLTDAGWAKSAGHARAGQKAELATAAVLDDYARSHPGVAVLHDLNLPKAGYTANIDHIVVSGRRVHLIDAKAWAPGFVWSFGDSAFRGFTRFEAATKKTLPMARTAIEGFLLARGAGGAELDASLVIWCSRREGRVTTWALRPPDARAVAGPALARKAKSLFGTRPAHPEIVSALANLVT